MKENIALELLSHPTKEIIKGTTLLTFKEPLTLVLLKLCQMVRSRTGFLYFYLGWGQDMSCERFVKDHNGLNIFERVYKIA